MHELRGMMRGATFLCAACLCAQLLTPSARAEAPVVRPVVRIDAGGLRGVTKDGVTSFKGIPYAAPPVHSLRWRAPATPAPWQGVRDASKAGHACYQFEGPSIVPPELGESEDCLTLNVWTAEQSAQEVPHKPRPVMVWIHGGGFTQGVGAGPFFAGNRFASLGVVLVTINYRLGPLGFFAHPALTAADPKGPLGNYGLLDQIAALRWVKTNIAAFGGDPERVTVFGESAGGNSVYALLVSPLASGLFQRAIAQSGFPRAPRATLQRAAKDPQGEAAETEGEALATNLHVDGNGPAALQALRKMPVKRLQDAFPPFAQRFNSFVDGVVVPEPVLDAVRAGRYAHVPLIVGATSFEASLWDDTRKDPESVLQRTGDRARALRLYDPKATLGVVRVAEDLSTDQHALEPARRVAELFQADHVPAFVYRFSYLPVGMRDRMPGAPHAGELGYVFGTLPKEPFKSYINGVIPAATPEDIAMSNAISAYWAAFAATGDPGSAGGPRWPAYTSDTRVTLDFAVSGPVARKALDAQRLDWLRELAEPSAPGSARPAAR